MTNDHSQLEVPCPIVHVSRTMEDGGVACGRVYTLSPLLARLRDRVIAKAKVEHRGSEQATTSRINLYFGRECQLLLT